MDIEKLNKIAYKDAKELGACDKVMGCWNRNLEVGELLDLWVHNQEFCQEHDFPSVPFIVTNTTKEDRENHNVYLDDESMMIRNKSGIMVVGGKSKGMVMADSFDAITIYLRHNANINISVKGFSRVFVHMYDNAILNISQDQLGKAYVYKRSASCKVETTGDVTIRKSY